MNAKNLVFLAILSLAAIVVSEYFIKKGTVEIVKISAHNVNTYDYEKEIFELSHLSQKAFTHLMFFSRGLALIILFGCLAALFSIKIASIGDSREMTANAVLLEQGKSVRDEEVADG